MSAGETGSHCQWRLSPDPDPPMRRVKRAQGTVVAALNSQGKAASNREVIWVLDTSVYNILNRKGDGSTRCPGGLHPYQLGGNGALEHAG